MNSNDDDARINRLSAQVEDLHTRLEKSEGGIARLSTGVAALAGQVEEHFGGREAGDGEAGAAGEGDSGESVSRTPRASAWVDMTENSAVDYLREVDEWVRLVGKSQNGSLRLQPCWPRHPAVVQMLSDLRTLWLTLYRSSAGGAWMLADWHLRYWPELSREVNSALQQCTPSKHEKPFRVSEETITAVARDAAAVAWGADTERRPLAA